MLKACVQPLLARFVYWIAREVAFEAMPLRITIPAAENTSVIIPYSCAPPPSAPSPTPPRLFEVLGEDAQAVGTANGAFLRTSGMLWGH